MNTTERTTVFGVNRKIARTVHGIMLFGMLHSTFVAPAQAIFIDYFNAPKPVVTKWGTFYEGTEKYTNEGQIIQGETPVSVSGKTVDEIKTSEKPRENQIYYSDIEQGFIGLSEDKPLDDAKDNLFRLSILNIPQNAKGYLKYDLYGVEGIGSVSRSINDLPSTGGHIIKKNNIWTSQQEELDVKWLREGENTILFTAPSLKGNGYKIKNLRIEFAENTDVTSSLVLNIDEKNLFKKDNKVYIKGFVNNAKTGLKVEAEDISLSVFGSQFEGVIELTDKILDKRFLVVKAGDNNGLLGQEIIPLTNLPEADLFVPFEVNVNASARLFPAFSGNQLHIEGAGIIVPDSALVERKNISISQLRKKDIAPLNSGLINVTKNGTAFRFLPDGTKFEKVAKILLKYDSKLIPPGYSEKDIKTFYFSTKTKSWVSIEKDSVDLTNKMIISNTDHFTDYINGIIQVPETPESSAFIPTMMSDIKAADPSAGITLISPPEVSQKGSAGVSYPIKVPAGRNGMQPSLAIQYNSDGGNGFLGQGWDISIPAITIDTRWGVPVLDNDYESDIYTLNGEQLMYPKIENLENKYEDWMPNRHYDDGFDTNNDIIWNTEPRGIISNAVFTPRKQGSFAKIERLGTDPTDYYWKVTDTNGTINWYGGKTAVVNNSVLKNSDGKVVHWSLYMVEDVFGNNIKYEYIKEDISSTNDINLDNLNGGVFYRINTIKYTGYNNADGGYSVVFNADDGDYRDDVTIDSRLGVKLVTPRVLSDIEVKEGTQLIRKYNLLYETGKFGKSRLEAVAEANGNNDEFYRHNFEYYDDLKDQQGNDIYFSSGVDIDTCDDDDGSPIGCNCIYYLDTAMPIVGENPIKIINTGDNTPLVVFNNFQDLFNYLEANFSAEITQTGSFVNIKICDERWLDFFIEIDQLGGSSVEIPTRPCLENMNYKTTNNFSYTFESLFGDPDCPSMLNLGFLVNGSIPSFNSTFSPLGSSSTISASIGGYLGLIGFGCNFLSKNSTLGAGYNVSGSKTKSEVSMIDINGDGLNDIVIQENGEFKYRPHIVTRTYDENGNEVITHSFGERRPITGISHFYNSVGKSDQLNFSFNSYASIGWEKSNSKSTTNVYFTDANGDGLVDIVKNGVVYFNRLNANGDPHFYHDSKETENLVIVAEPMSVEEPEEESEFVLPAYDVVKVWEAPADGTISINNVIELTDTSKEATITIEIKPVSNDPGEPGDPCSTCTNCEQCPECENCGDDECAACTNCEECPDCPQCDETGCDTCTNCEECPDCPQCDETGCDTCTNCEECPECEDCNCYVICRVHIPTEESPLGVFVGGVPVPGSPFTDLAEMLDVLNSLFPGYFELEDTNGGSGNLYYYGPEMPDISVSTHGYGFVRCGSEEGQCPSTSSRTNIMQIPSSTYDCTNINDLCLLFGANLNNTNSVVSTLITTFSEYCTSGGGTQDLTVKKGDRIYFRVHSVENGNPPINWNPEISYTNLPPNIDTVDQNGYNVYNSSYSDGFILSQPTSFVFPEQEGEIFIDWEDFQVNQPSDNVRFKIIERKINSDTGEAIGQDVIKYCWGCVTETSTTVASPNDFSINVSAPLGQLVQLLFVAESTSNVRWKDYPWNPVVTTRFTQNVIVEGNDEGELISNETYYPTVDYTVYKQYSCGPVYSTYDISQLTGNVSSIRPVYGGIFSNGDYGKVHFVVKNNGKLVGSRTLIVNNGNLSSVNGQPTHSNPIPLQNLTGTKIEIGFYVEDAKFYLNGQTLASKLAFAVNPTVKIVNHNIPKENVNIYHRNNKFGPMYRQWGQFFYNPDKVTGATSTDDYGNLIKEEVLFRDYSENDIDSLMNAADTILSNGTIQGDTNSTIDDILTGLESLQDNLNTELNGLESDLYDFMQEGNAFLPARAFRDAGIEDRWIGLHNENYATADAYRAATLQQSLSAEYDVEPYNFQGMLNTGAYGINKISQSKGQNISGGVSFVVGVSASKSINGEGKIVTEYTDLNGDRYPDVVTTNEIQFTNRTGGLKSPLNRTGEESIVTLNSNSNWGIGVSGGLGGNNDQQGSGKSYLPKNQVSPIYNSTKPNTSIGLSINFSKGKNFTDSFWSDVNGDGLPDLITKEEGDVFVYLNRGGKLEDTGYEWNQLGNVFNSEGINIGGGVGASLWNSSVQAGVSLTSSWNNTKNTFIDMNGDGLPDYVDTDNNLDVKINRGNRYMGAVDWSSFDLERESVSVTASKNAAVTFSLGFGIPFTDICIKFLALTGNVTLSTSTNKTEKMIIDFDGDGYPDLIKKINEGILIDEGVIRVYHSRIRRTDKLKSVTNPLGGKFTVDYKVHKVDYDNPNPKWVMSSVEIEDGYNLANDGHDVYRKEFVYENPRYDRRERDFYGFETVKTIDYTLDEEGEQDEIYRTSVTKYHNRSYFLNGLVKETAVYKGDMINNERYSKSENTYEIKALSDDNSIIDLTAALLSEDFDVGGSEGRRSAVVLLSKTKSYVYELGSSPLISESEMVYDQKGRVVEYKYLGAPGNNQDDYTTEITYHSDTALENKNIISVPSQVLVNVNNQVRRKRQTDNINLTTGAIQTIKHFYTTNAFAQVDLTYDDYGNIEKIEYPENDNSQRMSYTYQYDPTYRKHIIKVTDAFGYISQTSYNFSFDVPTEVTDIAGNKTKYTYDSFGRIAEVQGPKEIQANKPYTIQFRYFPKFADIQSSYGGAYNGSVSQSDFMPVALTKHYDEQYPNNTIDTYTFIDGLARPVQVKKDITVNMNGNPSANPNYLERMSVSGAVTYDEFGRAVKQYHPLVENKSNTVNFKYNNSNPSPNYFTQSIYDPMDRIVETLDEVQSQSFTEYSVEGNLHKTRSVVQQSSSVDIISESFKDVNGRVVKTNNIGPQGDIITTFNYNAMGELLSYTDDMDMTTEYQYDMLGRKTEMHHPDRGTTKYYYDKASNLTRLQTANLIAQGQYISYHYEYNRPKGVIFPQPQSGTGNLSDVIYEYGDSGNQTGRLIFQQDASGFQWFEYGNMGELIYNQRTVVAPSPALPTRTFETRFVYDSWNRLQMMTYPDGEEAHYYYDFGGNLNGIHGDMPYVERVDYNHYGERTYIKYGNGTETVYDYTPKLRRLNNLQVFASNNQVLLNNTYEYDKVGNVTDIANSAGIEEVNLMGGEYYHRYSYDNLNRLVNANGGFEGHLEYQQAINNDYQSDYDLNMTYDSTHRIVNKLQTHIKNGQEFLPNTYDNYYEYYEGTHRVKQIIDGYGADTEYFAYDLNGNIIQRYGGVAEVDKAYFWDEADRLRVLYQGEETLHHYIYDAGGQRVLKASSYMEAVYENGQLVDSNIQMDNYTSYPSSFLVVDPDGIYSKHYYAGTQRIAARIGHSNADEIFVNAQPKSGQVSNSESTGSSFNADELKTLQRKDLQSYLDKAGKEARLSFKEYKPNTEEQAQEAPPSEGAGEGSYAAYGGVPEELIYYYHPDHLGTATYLTDINGNAYEFFLNLPFGETMAEQHSQTADYVNRWKFTGHELDRETGLYYAGARYYDPRTSIWISVDPLAEKYPNISPYVYVANNPIGNIDPDGRQIIGVTKKDAQNFKADIHKVLADEKFAGVRTLIDVKGSTFKSIDAKALSTALDGVSLSADEKAYIDMVTNTINSKDVHKIEYLSGEFTSTEGATAFKDHMNKTQAGVGDAMVPNGKLSASLIDTMVGGGLNVPTKNGSHSFIGSGVTGDERAVTSGHELFGHGIPSARHFGAKANNANAIRTDNLIRRLLGMPERDGSDHGGFKEGHITEPKKLPVTE